ncbi:MAG: nitroreductase family deazaflavin-dependent oxidoreductase [Ktedonobacterales bacterium]
MARDRIRTFNKYVTNRVFRRFARSSRGPFAVIHHVGRRSGKPYETTIMVWPQGEDFVIALTYGPDVDWLRNLQASGQGTLFWHGKSYTIGKPVAMDPSAALSAFPSFIRFILGRLGTHQFVRVKAAIESNVGVASAQRNEA